CLSSTTIFAIASCLVRCTSPGICVRYAPACRPLTSTAVKDGGWRVGLAAHFDHPDVSNGPTENLNLKSENTERIARGYRNFDHYRLRLLLNHRRIHEDHSPTRIRTGAPR